MPSGGGGGSGANTPTTTTSSSKPSFNRPQMKKAHVLQPAENSAFTYVLNGVYNISKYQFEASEPR